MIERLEGPAKDVSYPPRRKGWTIAELQAAPHVVVVRLSDLEELEAETEAIGTEKNDGP